MFTKDTQMALKHKKDDHSYPSWKKGKLKIHWDAIFTCEIGNNSAVWPYTLGGAVGKQASALYPGDGKQSKAPVHRNLAIANRTTHTSTIWTAAHL